MSKRKARTEFSEDEDDDADIVDVDFEWFDPKEIDFEGIKLLLRQLFDIDNQLFDLSSICNLILEQPLGSTVKVSDEDGKTEETDPYAFLSLLNLHELQDHVAVKPLIDYVTAKAGGVPALAALPTLLSSGSDARVGLVLCERFINMPVQIVPPMFEMLLGEIGTAVKENESRRLSHYVVISKTYAEVEPEADLAVDTDTSRTPSKRQKASHPTKASETFYFHAEDETFQRLATGHGAFAYTRQGESGVAEARRVFQDAGIVPSGHLFLLTADQFAAAVQSMSKQFAA